MLLSRLWTVVRSMELLSQLAMLQYAYVYKPIHLADYHVSRPLVSEATQHHHLAGTITIEEETVEATLAATIMMIDAARTEGMIGTEAATIVGMIEESTATEEATVAQQEDLALHHPDQHLEETDLARLLQESAALYLLLVLVAMTGTDTKWIDWLGHVMKKPTCYAIIAWTVLVGSMLAYRHCFLAIA